MRVERGADSVQMRRQCGRAGAKQGARKERTGRRGFLRTGGGSGSLTFPNGILYQRSDGGDLATYSFVSGTQFDRSMSLVVGGADRIRTITFPDTVRGAFDFAFDNNKQLRYAVLNGGLERLGGFREFVCIGVFSDTLLKRVLLPATLKILGDDTFYGCRGLTSVTFAEGSRLEEIGRRCFAESGIASAVLPKTLRRIRDSAFCDWRSLKTIYVEDGCEADLSGLRIPASARIV